MYTPHTVTVFNTWEDAQTLEQQINVTILRGVFLDTVKGTNAGKDGNSSADGAELYIPFDVDAQSPAGAHKSYAEPAEFYTAQNRNALWTLDAGGKESSSATYFVKGTVTENKTFAQLKAQYDHVYDVTAVYLRDFGSADMRHRMVSAR